MNNWLRLGFTEDDVRKPGSDKLIDAVVAYGTPEDIAKRLNEHLKPAPIMWRSRCWAAGTKDIAAGAERTGRAAGTDSAEADREARLGFDACVCWSPAAPVHRRQFRA